MEDEKASSQENKSDERQLHQPYQPTPLSLPTTSFTSAEAADDQFRVHSIPAGPDNVILSFVVSFLLEGGLTEKSVTRALRKIYNGGEVPKAFNQYVAKHGKSTDQIAHLQADEAMTAITASLRETMIRKHMVVANASVEEQLKALAQYSSRAIRVMQLVGGVVKGQVLWEWNLSALAASAPLAVFLCCERPSSGNFSTNGDDIEFFAVENTQAHAEQPERSTGGRCDFTAHTKDQLAKRVGYLCSRCYRSLLGPKDEHIQGSLTPARLPLALGDCAHIYDASNNSENKVSKHAIRPRPHAWTDEQVKAFDNGIYLCKNCHKLVDEQPGLYTVAQLLNMKKKAECWALYRLNRDIYWAPQGDQIADVERMMGGQNDVVVNASSGPVIPLPPFSFAPSSPTALVNKEQKLPLNQPTTLTAAVMVSLPPIESPIPLSPLPSGRTSTQDRLLELRSAHAVEELSSLIVDVEDMHYPTAEQLRRVWRKYLGNEYLPAVQQKLSIYLMAFTARGGEVVTFSDELGLEVLEAADSFASHRWDHYEKVDFGEENDYVWNLLDIEEIAQRADQPLPFHLAAKAECIGAGAVVALGFAYDSFKWSNLRFLSTALVTLRTCFQQVEQYKEEFGAPVTDGLKAWIMRHFDDVERLSTRLDSRFRNYVQRMREYAQLGRAESDSVEAAILQMRKVQYLRTNADGKKSMEDFEFTLL